jgi:flavin-dependent dehydrogenase
VTYEVVVAGASFAGLAVAQAVRARVLLVDPKPLGDGQTSACGAPRSVVERAGAAAAIQQEHRSLVVHTPRRTFVWDLEDEPFCTFDYRRFCQLAWQRTGADLLQATARGFDGTWVHTSAGRFRAEVAVDCTGWRARLAGSSRPPRAGAGPRWRWFGIETEVPARFEPGLHFYFWPEVVADGYAWAFPCGEVVRFGVLSYRGRTRLGPELARFVARFGVRPRGYHGGFLGVGPGWPGAGRLFAAGDAAGHCLPLTGEGIRSALHAGWLVGGLVNDVLAGRLPLEAAHGRYRAYLRDQSRAVAFLAAATGCARRLPPALLTAAVAAWSAPALRRAFLRRYLGTFPAPAWEGAAAGLRGACGGPAASR